MRIQTRLAPSVFVILLVAAATCLFGAAAANGADAAGLLLFTADAEGHYAPCAGCPVHRGFGGLPRRATLVAAQREGTANGGAGLLLLDAGGALFGPESVATGGRGIVAAYERLQYDAVNLATSDFRLGAAHTADILNGARLHALSANLLDEQTGKPAFAPYVVKPLGGRRVAIVGVTEPPASLERLPHLAAQLSGLRVRPSAEALSEWLPRAKAEADLVVVLYHGPARPLRQLRGQFGDVVTVFLCGGVRPLQLPPGDARLVATDEHGKALGRVELGADQPAVSQLAVTPDLAEDAGMAALLAPPAADSATADAAAPSPDVPPADAAPADATSADAAPSEGAPRARLAPPPVSPPLRAEAMPPADPPATRSAEAPADAAAAAPSGDAPVAEASVAEAPVTNPPPPQRAPARQPVATKAEPAAPGVQPTPERGEKPAAPARGAAPARPKFCTHCGTRLAPSGKFCTHCGVKVAR